MKILWLDINSSYSHSSVALPAIHAQVSDRSEWEWFVVRGTINDDPGALAAAVAEHEPDVIAATFWLFTHRMQIEVLSRAVQLLPKTMIVCGGPEFLGDNETFLRQNRFISAVIRGEGEESLPKFLNSLEGSHAWQEIEGLCWIDSEDNGYHDNGIAKVMDFASLKYPEESCFFKWDKPFVQLETTRGCFNTCSFCVSGGEKPVRYQSLDQVASRLENIYAHGIKDIRVLDRTFNHDTVRACEMLDLFAKYEGKMRFHLEIHPSLLSDTLKAKLSSLPKGLLHLEAGIQSLDSKVLEESGRKGSLKSSLDGLTFLCSLDNVETHADLIAGLPSYNLEMLYSDIMTLMKIGVDELQIESLKVLPGTQFRMQSNVLELKFSPLPPYEILMTGSMSASDIKMAMNISRAVDFYYNCKAWQATFINLVISDPAFLMSFTAYLKDIMVLDSPLSQERRGVILYEYCRNQYPDKINDISIAWIQAGFSLKKEPAGNVVKIKDTEAYLIGSHSCMNILSGDYNPTDRHYLFTCADMKILFGYDSENHHPAPIFMAEIG